MIEYDISKDYNYTFKNAKHIELSLTDGKLILSKSLGTDNTAFLKVNVESNFLGYFYSPHVEISSDTHLVRDFFEYGGSGIRYMNISSLLKEDIDEIQLHSIFSTITSPIVELIYYPNSLPSDSKILVISPHPDDAEIAAFGLYSKFPNSFILTITAGESGEMQYDELYSDSLEHFRKKGIIRTINSVTVPLQAGINQNNVLNLGYFDGAIKEMYDVNPTPVFSKSLYGDYLSTFRKTNISNLKDSLVGTSNWNSLVENIEFVLRSYPPDIIVLPHPHMDSHTDHQYSSIAVIEALKNAKIEKGELFFYANHHLNSEFFPFGRTGGTIGLPPNFNDSFYFNSIYSHDLTVKDQMDKILALDGMNDLRPDTEWRFLNKSLARTFEIFKTSLKGQENSYFKRAIRSNEIFFVVPISEVVYDQENLQKLQFGQNLVSD